MICQNPDRERINKFCEAVTKGYIVFAHPNTAKLVNRKFTEEKLPYRVMSCDFMIEGNLYAIKPVGIFEIKF